MEPWAKLLFTLGYLLVVSAIVLMFGLLFIGVVLLLAKTYTWLRKKKRDFENSTDFGCIFCNIVNKKRKC